MLGFVIMGKKIDLGDICIVGKRTSLLVCYWDLKIYPHLRVCSTSPHPPKMACLLLNILTNVSYRHYRLGCIDRSSDSEADRVMADQQELMLLKLQEQHKQLEQMLKGHKEKMEKSSAKRRRHPPEPSQTPNNFQMPKTIAQPPFGHSNPSQGGSKHSNIRRGHLVKIELIKDLQWPEHCNTYLCQVATLRQGQLYYSGQK